MIKWVQGQFDSHTQISRKGKKNLVLDEKGSYVPSDIALTKIMDARMKMMRDARPRAAINLLTTCCPTKAESVATATRYRAAQK